MVRSLSPDSVITKLHISLPSHLLLPVCVWLTAVLHLYLFSHNMGKSKFSYAFKEKSHFYYFKNPVTFDLWNRFLRFTVTDFFKPRKTVKVPVTTGQNESYICTTLREVHIWKFVIANSKFRFIQLPVICLLKYNTLKHRTYLFAIL
jgi:hypothetical protein